MHVVRATGSESEGKVHDTSGGGGSSWVSSNGSEMFTRPSIISSEGGVSLSSLLLSRSMPNINVKWSSLRNS